MEKRLQTINGDTILEVTENTVKTTRHSEKSLLVRKQYLEGMIESFEAQLQDVDKTLAEIEYEKGKR